MQSQRVVLGRVSVIVAVYQGEALVLGAIRSALAQTYIDLEVIVVDDGSTDGTAALLETVVDPRIMVLQQANQGTAAARNLALTNASGEYIAYLDADDRWFPKKVEIEVRTLKASADPCAIVYSWFYAVDEDGRLLNRSRRDTVSGNVFNIMLHSDFNIMGGSALFHQRVFEEVGGFDPQSYHEDGSFMLKATRMFPVFPAREYLLVYRQTTDGKCRQVLVDFDKARSASLSIVDELRPLLSSDEASALHDQAIRELYLRFLMYGYGSFAARLLPDIDIAVLRHGLKGWIAWLHAKTGMNFMRPIRLMVQWLNGSFRQGAWRRELSRQGLELDYGGQ